MCNILACFLLACCVGAAPAAAMHWQPAPQKKGMHQNRMAAKQFVLTQSDGTAVFKIVHPDLVSSSLTPDEHGKISIKSTGKDNYHALIASRQTNSITETAIRYLFMFGKPSGHSPTELTTSKKSNLEIVPSPLPREHQRYTSNRPARFLLRFNGQPLVNTPVSVSTSNGSMLNISTDSKGILSMNVPDDFAMVKAGEENNPAAEWRIEAVHQHSGHSYKTIFSAAYHADPNHWQSLPWGLATVAGGMLFVAALGMRRRKNRPVRRGKTRRKMKRR